MGDFNKIDGLVEMPISGGKPDALAWVEKNGVGVAAETEAGWAVLGEDGKTVLAGPFPAKVIYLMGRVANRIKARYEDWLEGSARRRVFKFRKEFQPDEYRESMDAVARACASGTFSWGGDAWQASLQQLPGVVKMIHLLCDEADMKLGTDRAQKVDESKILEWFQDPVTAEDLRATVQEILRATPNFLSPPTRGTDP